MTSNSLKLSSPLPSAQAKGKGGGRYVESIWIDEMGADGVAESQQWGVAESTVAEGRERAASWLLGGVSAELA